MFDNVGGLVSGQQLVRLNCYFIRQTNLFMTLYSMVYLCFCDCILRLVTISVEIEFVRYVLLSSYYINFN